MGAQLINLQTGIISSVEKSPFQIGREPSWADLCVSDSSVSRAHCSIRFQGNSWYVVDCNSTNRTYINGAAIQPHVQFPLRYGDELQLALVRYRFEEVL